MRDVGVEEDEVVVLVRDEFTVPETQATAAWAAGARPGRTVTNKAVTTATTIRVIPTRACRTTSFSARGI